MEDDSLVDPDNRRPVDFDKRRRVLEDLRQFHMREPRDLSAELTARKDADRTKLFVAYCGLQARKQHPDLFSTGSYLPLALRGARAAHALAFARKLKGAWSLTIVPRFLSRITTPETLQDADHTWQDTYVQLPPDAPHRWRSAFSGAGIGAGGNRLRLHSLFNNALPVALLLTEV